MRLTRTLKIIKIAIAHQRQLGRFRCQETRLNSFCFLVKIERNFHKYNQYKKRKLTRKYYAKNETKY